MHHASLTVSVVSHGHMALIRPLMDDLEALPAGTLAQVILTLNLAGEDASGIKLTKVPLQVVRNHRPKGFGENHNHAFERSSSEYFAVVNPDIRLDLPTSSTTGSTGNTASASANPFAILSAALGANALAAVAAPRVVTPEGVCEDSWRPYLTPARLWGRIKRHTGQAGREAASQWSAQASTADWAAGMFLLFRATHFRAVGGFDAGYFMYCEDMDICTRLHARGYALAFVPEAQVVHDARRASAKSLQHLMWHASSLWRYWRSAAYRRRHQHQNAHQQPEPQAQPAKDQQPNLPTSAKVGPVP